MASANIEAEEFEEKEIFKKYFDNENCNEFLLLINNEVGKSGTTQSKTRATGFVCYVLCIINYVLLVYQHTMYPNYCQVVCQCISYWDKFVCKHVVALTIKLNLVTKGILF
jgi:hypothetical protein